MLGLLLARAGIDVTVVERHTSFLDDFRGDTLQPATLAALTDLGLTDRFAQLPTTPITRATLPDRSGRPVVVADYGALARWGVPHPYMTLAPQDAFLQLLADAAAVEPTFHLRMGSTATRFLQHGGAVTGVRIHDAVDPTGSGQDLHADLVIGCDGRDSPLAAELSAGRRRFPVPFDTWWFRLPRDPGEGAGELTRAVGRGRFAVVIPRPTYFQIGYTTTKGTDAALRSRGIAAFRADVAELLPRFRDRVHTLRSMAEVRHLDVRLERLRRWHASGLLLVGDAAHPMSPVGGVGVHLAIQDAIAAARILTPTLRQYARPTTAVLARVRRRRLIPTMLTQLLQRLLHADFSSTFGTAHPTGQLGPLVLSLLRLPLAPSAAAYLFGVGIPTERIPTSSAPRFERGR